MDFAKRIANILKGYVKTEREQTDTFSLSTIITLERFE